MPAWFSGSHQRRRASSIVGEPSGRGLRALQDVKGNSHKKHKRKIPGQTRTYQFTSLTWNFPFVLLVATPSYLFWITATAFVIFATFSPRGNTRYFVFQTGRK